jgi:hypothetical protein
VTRVVIDPGVLGSAFISPIKAAPALIIVAWPPRPLALDWEPAATRSRAAVDER